MGNVFLFLGKLCSLVIGSGLIDGLLKRETFLRVTHALVAHFCVVQYQVESYIGSVLLNRI